MVPYKVVPCKYDHYCIALLFVCCILWAPPYANAQRFDVRPRGDIARHQRYIPVLQALDKAAEEAVQACQTSNDQMTWAMAQMAIQAFHAGNKATQDRPGGDEEVCSILDQEKDQVNMPRLHAQSQRKRLRELGQDVEQHVHENGPWQYKFSRLYDAPEVTAVVESIAAGKQPKVAA